MAVATGIDYGQLDRGALTRKFQRAAADLMPAIWKQAEHEEKFYVVGSGYDFEEFAAAVASQISANQLAGVACIWTSLKRYPFHNGDRSFAIQQQMVEPLDGKPIVLFCQSIIADRFEVLTSLLSILDGKEAHRIVLVSFLISKGVEAELKEALRSYAPFPVESLSIEVSPQPVEGVRDTVESSLDDREERYAPLMSEWLMTRKFGPKPNPSPKRSSAPTPLG